MGSLSKGYFLLLALFAVSCHSDSKKNNSAETELRNSIQSYVEDYNKHDAEKLGEYYTQDAVYYYPDTGDSIQGRAAIVQMFKDVLQDDPAQLTLNITKIDFTDPDHATEHGTATLTFADKTKEESVYVAQNVKEDGKWRTRYVSEVNVEVIPTYSEHLQDLAWMVGKWSDTSDEFDIVNDVSWDKNKNFLKNQFTVQVLGKDQIEGTQIIGWDPNKEQVRSWLFDSDGGIGLGAWKQVDGSWFVDMSYVLGDGRKASAQHIYKQIDDKYTFTSLNRDIDGEVLPDIDPVTFVKATK